MLADIVMARRCVGRRYSHGRRSHSVRLGKEKAYRRCAAARLRCAASARIFFGDLARADWYGAGDIVLAYLVLAYIVLAYFSVGLYRVGLF